MHWKLFANRGRVPILFFSIIFPGYCFSYIRKKRGLNVGQDYKKVDSSGDVYFVERDFKISGSRLLSFIIKNPIKAERLLKKCFQEGESFIKFANKIEKQKLEILSQKEILKIWREFKKRSQDFAFWLVVPQTIDKYLEKYLIEKIIRPKIKRYKVSLNENDVLGLIIKPQQKIFIEEEQEDFLKLLQWIKKNKLSLRDPKVQLKIEKHLSLYAWTSTHLWIGKPLTRQDLIKEIRKKLFKAESLLEELGQRDKLAKKKFNSLIKQLNFSKQEKLIIKIAKAIVFIRTYRTDTYSLVGYRFRKFFTFLAKQFDLTFKDFSYLKACEVEEAIRAWDVSSKLKKEIETRKKAFVYYSIKDKERIIYKAKIKERKFITKEIRGKVAYPGQLKGKVKIVLKKKDFAKIKNKDILVTSMTSPDFMVILKKVAAIITNEGGITCHAAIVSRELGIPCIIGTKIATRALKDGDFVEVDANKGTVKIIKENEHK